MKYVDEKAVKAYENGVVCAPTRGHFKVGSRAGEPDGYGVKIEAGKVKLIKYMPATNAGNVPMGTKEIIVTEKVA
jgi:hypothetical protein